MKRRNFILASTGLAAGGLVAPLARAATKPCPPPQISIGGVTTASAACPVAVTAPNGNSALALLAASMAPGTWSRLTVANQNTALADVGVSGSPLHFSNSMPWNPKSRTIEIVAGDHNGATPSMRHIRYVESSNSFVEAAARPAVPGIGHGYDHSDVNPYTGDLYHRLYGGGSSINALRKAQGASSFTAIPSASTSYAQVAIAACWWSGAFAGAGSQGCWMVFNSGASTGTANDGHIVAFNPLTNSWFFSKTGMAPYYMSSGSTYHSVMEYSARKNVAVYGGGNDAPTKLWRLNADGTSTPMPAVPSGKSVGIQKGNLACDPVTGNFLLLSAGQLWELNPTGAGTWTQLTGTRAPAAGVGNPTALAGVISCAMPEHGVVAYITQSSTTGGTFFLYKHG